MIRWDLHPGAAETLVGEELLVERSPTPEPADGAVTTDSFTSMAISCDVFVQGRRRPERILLADVGRAAAAEDGFVWVDLRRPTAGDLAEVRAQLGLPALAVHDSVRTHTRPTLQVHADVAVVVLRTISYVDHDKIVDSSEVSIVLGATFVVTIRQDDSPVLRDVRAQIDQHPDDVLGLGSASVLLLIAGLIVDGYEEAIENMNDDLDTLESEVFSPGEHDQAERIYKLKRQIADFRRAAVPLARGLEQLDNSVPVLGNIPHQQIQKVLDHALRVADEVENFDRLLNAVMQANVARVNADQSRTALRQNEDTRKISAWAAIALVPTMITGVYGMNFVVMPELQWEYGYPLVLLVIVLSCTTLHRLFVRNGWL